MTKGPLEERLLTRMRCLYPGKWSLTTRYYKSALVTATRRPSLRKGSSTSGVLSG